MPAQLEQVLLDKTVAFRIDPDTHKQLLLSAANKGLSEALRAAIREHLATKVETPVSS